MGPLGAPTAGAPSTVLGFGDKGAVENSTVLGWPLDWRPLLLAFLLLVVRPGAPFIASLLLVARPGAPS